MFASVSLYELYSPRSFAFIINFHSYGSHTFGRTPWKGGSVCLEASDYSVQYNTEERQDIPIYILRVWIEPMIPIPMFERLNPVMFLTQRGHCDHHYVLFRPVSHRFEIGLFVTKNLNLDTISRQVKGTCPWNNYGNQKRSHQATDFSDMDTTCVRCDVV
jgi:hypothetical protein